MEPKYLGTKQVAELLNMTPRQARAVMKDVGLVKVGHGLVSRDALERYLELNTQCTYYTRPLLPQHAKPRYQRKKEA